MNLNEKIIELGYIEFKSDCYKKGIRRIIILEDEEILAFLEHDIIFDQKDLDRLQIELNRLNKEREEIKFEQITK